MQKKKLVGLLGLAFVVLMTVFAYFLPDEASAVEASHSDVIRVTVYDQYPSVSILKPENEAVFTSSVVNFTVNYENAQYVDFVLSYVNENGETKEVALPRFNPTELDPIFNIASGTAEFSIDLADYVTPPNTDGHLYNRYIVTAKSTSNVGYAENATEFNYVPAKLTQSGSDDQNNDPVVVVDYDNDVAKVEVMPVDKDGNPLFDEPIVIEIPEPYEAGSKEVTLPFGSYGLASGDYDVIVTAYSKNDVTGAYGKLTSPVTSFGVSYTQPNAPDIPNTGRFLGNLNISSTDLAITAVLVFSFATILAFVILSHKKKDYRKNLRSRK